MKPTSPAVDELTRLTDEDILALVQTKSRRFQRQIRFRDWGELVASAAVAILIAPAAIRGPLVARAGALVILGGLALVAFRLWQARPGARSAMDVTLPVATALGAELRRVDAQIALLRGVAWWYIAPLVGGSVLLVAGWHGRAGWRFTLGYAIGAALLSWGIIALNQRAVRRVLQPKRNEILDMLAQIES